MAVTAIMPPAKPRNHDVQDLQSVGRHWQFISFHHSSTQLLASSESASHRGPGGGATFPVRPRWPSVALPVHRTIGRCLSHETSEFRRNLHVVAYCSAFRAVFCILATTSGFKIPLPVRNQTPEIKTHVFTVPGGLVILTFRRRL